MTFYVYLATLCSILSGDDVSVLFPGEMVQKREGEVASLSRSLGQVTQLVTTQLDSLDSKHSQQTTSGQQWLDVLADHCTHARVGGLL